jgi:hypothetical protein
MIHRLRVWTGPTLVHGIAEKVRLAGLTVTIVGTEHLYVDIETKALHDQDVALTGEQIRLAAEHNFRAALRACHDTDFGLRPEWIFSLEDPHVLVKEALRDIDTLKAKWPDDYRGRVGYRTALSKLELAARNLVGAK